MAIASIAAVIASLGRPQKANILVPLLWPGCNKLREQNSVAASMQIFIRTSPFDKGKQYGNRRLVTPSYPSANRQGLNQTCP